jgi:hypothetical protein
MALPSSGSISMYQVRQELGESGSISLGQSSVRSLAGRSSGSISLGDLRGKSNWDGSLSSLNSQYSDGQQDSDIPVIEVAFLPDGRIRIRGRYSETFDGRWDGSIADSSNTEIKFVLTSDMSGGNFVSISATTYSQLSSTRAISLQGNEPFASISVRVYLRSTSGGGTISKIVELRTTYSGDIIPR